MSMSDLYRPEFIDAGKAREWLENELWADGRPCPHCGVLDQSTKVGGTTARTGLHKRQNVFDAGMEVDLLKRSEFFDFSFRKKIERSLDRDKFFVSLHVHIHGSRHRHKSLKLFHRTRT